MIAVPQLVCRDNFIQLPFGGKTKVPGACSEVMQKRTIRNTIVNQSREQLVVQIRNPSNIERGHSFSVELTEPVNQYINQGKLLAFVNAAVEAVLQDSLAGVLDRYQSEIGMPLSVPKNDVIFEMTFQEQDGKLTLSLIYELGSDHAEFQRLRNAETFKGKYDYE